MLIFDIANFHAYQQNSLATVAFVNNKKRYLIIKTVILQDILFTASSI
jgi:hypothetical protein